MPKACFVVRALVEEPLRKRFDAWYSAHHLPTALSEFRAEKCWRFWSAADPSVHYAVYQFPEDQAELLAALVGAVLGIVAGYLSGNGWFIMVIWAIVFAIVASEGVRAFL
jgi:hypothetical protein